MNVYHSGNTNNFEGKYIRQDQCNKVQDSTNSHIIIGLGVVVALLSLLLLVVTGGWVWTCWIMRKTTEIR